MIPIISGNLSVDHLLRLQVEGALSDPELSRLEVEQFEGLPVSGLEDYIAWGGVEREPGRFDFRYHRRHLEECRRRGYAYVVYPWLHVVPDWYLQADRFTGFRCLEHDRECAWPSLFAPDTMVQLKRFYAALAAALGDGVDALCVALPADYGEVAYPTGLADWVARLPPPRDHMHEGYWVGDPFARKAMQSFLEQRFGSLAQAGRSCALDLSGDACPVPTLDCSEAYRLAFAEFYHGSLSGFAAAALEVARHHFPTQRISLKVGHGSEKLAYGIDPTAIVRAAARWGATVRTTQASLPELHHKRLASPCRFYGVPFATEPPADIGREIVVQRLFCDASCGVVEYFDYPEHLVGARDLLERYGGLLDGRSPQIDVGLLFASTDQALRPDQGLPPVLLDLTEPLRDGFDFEVVDESMIADGALAPLRVLGVPEAHHLLPAAQARLVEWVRGGGCLVAGPDVDPAALEEPLAGLLALAPDASQAVELLGAAAESMLCRMGESGESLWLSGDWQRREGASQFRGTVPLGEWARWSGKSAAVLFPVRSGCSYLLEIDCWIHPLTAGLRHDVLVNGQRLGRLARQGLQRFAAWVPAATLAGASGAEVRIDSETFRLADLGMGEDRRDLGAAVMWLRLTEEGSSAAGLDRARSPRLQGRIRDPSALGAALDRGLLWVARRRPLLYFTTLLKHAVECHSRRHAQVRQILPGADLDGLRATLFDDSILVWNRSDRVRSLPSARGPVSVPPGGLARLPRESS